jgi:hypothetical protein
VLTDWSSDFPVQEAFWRVPGKRDSKRMRREVRLALTLYSCSRAQSLFGSQDALNPANFVVPELHGRSLPPPPSTAVLQSPALLALPGTELDLLVLRRLLADRVVFSPAAPESPQKLGAGAASSSSAAHSAVSPLPATPSKNMRAGAADAGLGASGDLAMTSLPAPVELSPGPGAGASVAPSSVVRSPASGFLGSPPLSAVKAEHMPASDSLQLTSPPRVAHSTAAAGSAAGALGFGLGLLAPLVASARTLFGGSAAAAPLQSQSSAGGVEDGDVDMQPAASAAVKSEFGDDTALVPHPLGLGGEQSLALVPVLPGGLAFNAEESDPDLEVRACSL